MTVEPIEGNFSQLPHLGKEGGCIVGCENNHFWGCPATVVILEIFLAALFLMSIAEQHDVDVFAHKA